MFTAIIHSSLHSYSTRTTLQFQHTFMFLLHFSVLTSRVSSSRSVGPAVAEAFYAELSEIQRTSCDWKINASHFVLGFSLKLSCVFCQCESDSVSRLSASWCLRDVTSRLLVFTQTAAKDSSSRLSERMYWQLLIHTEHLGHRRKELQQFLYFYLFIYLLLTDVPSWVYMNWQSFQLELCFIFIFIWLF